MLPLIDLRPVANTNIAVGWTCGICGMWISGEATHVCGGSTDAAPRPVYIDPVIAKLDRIIELLESIKRLSS